jgi:hypothetical protein
MKRRQLKTYGVLVRPPDSAPVPRHLFGAITEAEWRRGARQTFRSRARAAAFLEEFPASELGQLGYRAEPDRWPLGVVALRRLGERCG